MSDATITQAEIDALTHSIGGLRDQIGRIIVGQTEVVDQVILALFAGGHILLEGVPGLGKTLLVRTLADALSLDFSRVQFTPDLMPADITGTNIVVEDAHGRRSFEFQRGPVFANVVLADEINRATPKTQSALLEAMEEGTVTVGGVRHELPDPFFVLATQNPIEMEGTYPLPEAQLDRFLLKTIVSFPERTDLMTILDRTTGSELPDVAPALGHPEIARIRGIARDVIVAEPQLRHASDLVLATHPDDERAPDEVRRFIRFGASPRGGQAMVLTAKVRALMDGRVNVAFEDLRAVARPTLRHRIILNFEGEAEGRSPDDIIDAVLEAVRP